ncbi:MAG: CDP-diacylglycerol--serine O-phosphatidyltransferase, partial [Alphaproteobacteria bacterium]|nr:CDP-diacylglycerol--serine O-phosphatidyltransferase [Alphaproteobacteria bacterium]
MLDHDPFEERQSENLTLRQILPNAVTILGLCSGLMALRFAQAGRVDLAVMLILLAGVLDGLDGIIARRLDATSKMGAELDSLADFLNFGVAPAVVVFQVAMASSS